MTEKEINQQEETVEEVTTGEGAADPAAVDPDSAPQEAAGLEALEAENQELKDRMLRLAADLENYKKRTERDKALFLERANESLLKDLLPVLDALDRALAHADTGESGESMQEGISLIQQDMDKALQKHGLEPISALGQPFNPELHEAVMQQEDPEHEDGTVLTEYQKGYLYRDRLLRPAMVVVSKRPAGGDEDGTPVNVHVH